MILGMQHAIGCDNVKLFADDTFLFMNDRNIDVVKEKASDLFENIFRWCVANQLSINSEKTNFVLFHAKNKPIPENFDCIQTTYLTIDRVKCVQYLGLMIDENLYWHMHVEHVYNSLLKYFGIFNRIKTMITRKIARQLYFAFIHSRIKYGIEVFGDCANEYLQKLQVIQNKLLKLLLNFDRRTSTNELHHQLSLLKVVDIHNVNVLSFVNECRSGRCPTLFSNYYHVREAGYDLRQKDRLHVPMARTDIGQSCCKNKGARLWNNAFNTQQLRPQSSVGEQGQAAMTSSSAFAEPTNMPQSPLTALSGIACHESGGPPRSSPNPASNRSRGPSSKFSQHSEALQSRTAASESSPARSSPRAAGRRQALSLASQFKKLPRSPHMSTPPPCSPSSSKNGSAGLQKITQYTKTLSMSSPHLTDRHSNPSIPEITLEPPTPSRVTGEL